MRDLVFFNEWYPLPRVLPDEVKAIVFGFLFEPMRNPWMAGSLRDCLDSSTLAFDLINPTILEDGAFADYLY